MKVIFTGACILLLATALAQTPLDRKPKLGPFRDMSAKGEMEWKNLVKDCEKLAQALADGKNPEMLTVAEQKLSEECDLMTEDYWDVLGPGCSWYCGAGQDTIFASSYLKSSGTIDYKPRNIHDLNYRSAWVEGVPGHGIGESVTYRFPPGSPRITQVNIVNGLVKSPEAWQDNSRAKTLKMYVNEKLFAVLHLLDSRREQYFDFEPIGHNRKDPDKRISESWWTIRFEIAEVYEGDKYDDTAISEIYFDGIDVH